MGGREGGGGSRLLVQVFVQSVGNYHRQPMTLSFLNERGKYPCANESYHFNSTPHRVQSVISYTGGRTMTIWTEAE